MKLGTILGISALIYAVAQVPGVVETVKEGVQPLIGPAYDLLSTHGVEALVGLLILNL